MTRSAFASSLVGVGSFLVAGAASALTSQTMSNVQSSISTAGDNAGSIAGYVIIAVASMAGVGIIISLIRKV